MMTSHYEAGCALKTECGCPVRVYWHPTTTRRAWFRRLAQHRCP